jgi:hypothetical protein
VIFRALEDTLEYFTGDMTKVQVFGKWHPIPRKQVRVVSAWTKDMNMVDHLHGSMITCHSRLITFPLCCRWSGVSRGRRPKLQVLRNDYHCETVDASSPNVARPS